MNYDEQLILLVSQFWLIDHSKMLQVIVLLLKWRHQAETFSALQAIVTGNSPVTGEFPSQRLFTRSVDVFFDIRPNKRLSKQSWGWWFETPSHSLWRHCNNNDIRKEL